MSRLGLTLLLTVVVVDDPGRGTDADYPQQFTWKLDGRPIVVRAAETVRSQALRDAALKVARMLRDVRPDIRGRLADTRFELIVIPMRARMTDLPEFRDLKGRRDPHGQPCDDVRGIFRGHPALPRPVVAVSEEDVLNLMPKVTSTLHHELGHAVHRLGLTDAQRQAWSRIYRDARARQLFGKKYAGVSEDEFFAELTTVFFNKHPYLCSPEQLAQICPAGYAYLEAVYLGGRQDRQAEGEPGAPAEGSQKR